VSAIPDILGSLWPIVLSLFFAAAWFFRLEFRVGQLEKTTEQTKKDLNTVKNDYAASNSKLLEEVTKLRESLARIEGALHIPKKRHDN
jgi:hypothetical protein